MATAVTVAHDAAAGVWMRVAETDPVVVFILAVIQRVAEGPHATNDAQADTHLQHHLCEAPAMYELVL